MRLLGFAGYGRSAASAASYTVCTAGPPACDYGRIQDAVDAAGDGDEIKLASGTYASINNHGGFAQVVYVDRNITIRGGYTLAFSEPPDPEVNPTILDAAGQGRGLYVTGGVTVTIQGLRITGGDATAIGTWDDGGGVFIDGATATLSDNQIYDNSAHEGGGVRISNSLVTLANNRVSSNTASDSGGGLWLESSAASLSDNTIISNTANNGGGIWMWDCHDAYLKGNTISGNRAIVNGGGWWSMNGDGIIFRDNTVAGNSANWGGGINLTGNRITLAGNTVISNSAQDHGGGLSLGGEIRLTGNAITANRAVAGAGGIALGDGNPTLINNIIADNQADIGGGVQQVAAGAPTYIRNRFSGNSAGFGGGMSIGEGTLDYNTFISNTATFQGGGLYLSDSPTLNGNTFSGNSADAGGGIFFNESDARLTNNVIVGNQATWGSGLAAGESAPRLLHTTVARNSGGDGHGIYVSSGRISLTNTILVSQTSGIRVELGSTASLTATLWGSGAWANESDWSGGGTIVTGTLNLWGDPAFVDPDAGDYHIGPSSAAVDGGINAAVTTDVDFQPRPYQTPDLGADEYWPPGALKYAYLPLVVK